jgi:arylformamidase
MYVELSLVHVPGMPIYADSPRDRIEAIESMDAGDVANTSCVRHFLHNGTHVDAPRHFVADGECIDSIPIDRFIFEAPKFLELPKGPGDYIQTADLQGKGLESADAVLIRTGFDALREKDIPSYRFRYPSFSGEGARWLRANCSRLKAVVLDFMSADSIMTGPGQGFPAHHAFLGTAPDGRPPVLIVECAELRPLVGKRIRRVFALPVRFARAEAAPVCLVAELDD